MVPASVAVPLESVRVVPAPAMLPVEVWLKTAEAPLTVMLELFKPPVRVSVPLVNKVEPV